MVRVKQIEIYVTEDGSEFHSKKEAQEWEAGIYPEVISLGSGCFRAKGGRVFSSLKDTVEHMKLMKVFSELEEFLHSMWETDNSGEDIFPDSDHVADKLLGKFNITAKG